MIGALITYLVFVRVDFAREAGENSGLAPAPQKLIERTVRITRGAGVSVAELTAQLARDGDALLVRLRRGPLRRGACSFKASRSARPT